MAAPDYVAPIVGWRGWFVVEAEGALRLCSIVYHTLWPPRQELVASCRSQRVQVEAGAAAAHRARGDLPLRDLRLRVGWRGSAALVSASS
jgi:hypothetical protein